MAAEGPLDKGVSERGSLPHCPQEKRLLKYAVWQESAWCVGPNKAFHFTPASALTPTLTPTPRPPKP